MVCPQSQTISIVECGKALVLALFCFWTSSIICNLLCKIAKLSCMLMISSYSKVHSIMSNWRMIPILDKCRKTEVLLWLCSWFLNNEIYVFRLHKNFALCAESHAHWIFNWFDWLTLKKRQSTNESFLQNNRTVAKIYKNEKNI